MKTRRVSLIVLCLLAAAIVTLVFAYLFRVVHDTNPALGEMYAHYRWGKARFLKIDSNFDGAIDCIARFDPPREVANIPPDEMWEDRDYDGYFEVHLIDREGELRVLEIDSDQDGVFETRLRGAAIKDWYAAHPRYPPDRPERRQ